ncbi:MAG TPA: c-type cytochrome [Nitriliruptorales bacterium]|nr:c-type cytochrome [Nitriliruptorales bacterium]
MRRHASHKRDARTRRPVAVASALLVAVSALATAASAQTGASDDRDVVERGRSIYGQHCATCHGAQGRGTSRFPSIDRAPPALVDFMIRTGRMPLPAADARSVRRPPALNEEERLAVVAYMRTFAPDEPAIPKVAMEGGDLSHGQEVYANNCIACHGAFARGAAVGEGDIAPTLDAASPVEVAEAVRTGPGVMPLFGPELIDDEEMDSLARYVAWVTDERGTPGGVTVGRSGPVSEGFVAWILGLVGILVAVVFIGERRGG